MKSRYSRRDVVRNGSIILGGVTFLGLTACTGKKQDKPAAPAEEAPAQAEKPAAAASGDDALISPDHPTAKALQYVPDASTVDAAKKIEKSGVPGNQQNCANCNFYKAVEGKEYGVCQLIPVPNKHVTAAGWCATWAKKG